MVASETATVRYDPILCDFELPLSGVFYPMGFRVEISTNSRHVLSAAEDSWGQFSQAFSEAPLKLHIGVTADGPAELPTPPLCRGRDALVANISDVQNFAICDTRHGFAFAWLTQATAENRPFLRYHFLESSTLILLMSRYLAPIHGACVASNGHGVLLCGDSGAGKSSLAFACARRGWSFISDDSSAIVRQRSDRLVVGNPYQMRFRESAVELFAELRSERITRRVNGELAIEVATPSLDGITRAPSAIVDHVIFLCRHSSGGPELVPYSRESALSRFEQVLCVGEQSVRDAQRTALRRLLTAQVFELHYSDLDAAVTHLDALVRTWA